MTHQADDVREVLRAVWAAHGEAGDEFDDDCSPTKSCKNMQSVSFDGLGEPGRNLSDAWRDKLAREGKLNTSGTSIRDLVLGPAEPH